MRPATRRSVLRGVVTGFALVGAGCSGRSDDEGPPSSTPTDRWVSPTDRQGSPTPTASRTWTSPGECVPDLVVVNGTERTLTVSLTSTAMGGRYAGGSPTPTRGSTPVTETPVEVFSDAFSLEPYPADGHQKVYRDRLSDRTGFHRLDVATEGGRSRSFPYRPPYGNNSGFRVFIDEEEISGSEGGGSCD